MTTISERKWCATVFQKGFKGIYINKPEKRRKICQKNEEKYANQMAENLALQINKNFWLVVKKKPKWLPSFLYKAVIKSLIEIQQHKINIYDHN